MSYRVAGRSWRVALLAAWILTWGGSAFAQTLIDPRRVEFTPSPDHSALEADGSPRLEFYDLVLYIAGQSTRIDTMDLGKPAPEADGKIRVEFISLLASPLVAGLVYEARVEAVGPGGRTSSGVSNTFAIQLPCAPAIAPLTTAVAAGASTGSVAVTADPGCAWTSVSNASWLTITSGSSGSGPGSVGFSAAANTSASSRTGTLKIAGITFTVTQAGVSCTYNVSPQSQQAAAAGGNGSITVTSPTGCGWTASSNAAWLTVNTGASGSGNGTVTFSAAANPTTSTRTGTILVAGVSFTVTQAASPCSYTLTPPSVAIDADALDATVLVTAPAGCAWTAATAASWLTIDSGSSGSGPGAVVVSFDPYTSMAPRSATMTIAGQTVGITQAGVSCSYTLTPISQTFGASGGAATIVVATTAGCAWKTTSNVSWITVTGSGTAAGPGSVALSIAANTSASLRTGTATVAGRTFTATQTGAGCNYDTTPDTVTIVKAGGTGTLSVAVSSGCTWTAASTASWLTVTGTGPGGGTVTYTATPNTSQFSRVGVIVLASVRILVTQTGGGTLPAPPRNLRMVPKNGGG